MAIRDEAAEWEVDQPVDEARLEAGRARIVAFKTAKDGRRYATAVADTGRTVVIWGGRDTSIEELCRKADAKLPPLLVEVAEPIAADEPAPVEPVEEHVEAESIEAAEPEPVENTVPMVVETAVETQPDEPSVEDTEAEPVEDTVPVLIEDTELEQVEDTEPEPIDVTDLEPVEDTEPEPVGVEDAELEQVEDTEPEPIDVTELEPVEDTEPELVVAGRPQPSFGRRWRARLGAAALGVACCLLAVLGVGLLVGYRPVVLTTASMSPVAPAGSLLIAETVQPEAVEVGDILVMKRSTGLIITHRVVERSVRDGVVMVRTKGDANDDPDATPYSVVGTHRRSEWVIPSAGKALLLLRTRIFRLCIIAILATLIVYIGTTELRRLLRPQPLAGWGKRQPSQVK